MRRPLHFLWRRLGRVYPRVAILVWFQVGWFIALGGVALLTLYQDMSAGQFGIILAAAMGLTALEILSALLVIFRMLRPARPWLRGDRSPRAAETAWQTMAGLPLRFVRYRTWLAVPVNMIPIAVFVWLYLDLEWYTLPILMAGTGIVLLYGLFLRFFGLELILRPMLEAAARDVPEGVRLDGTPALALRWRLLLALPAINVITGVVVAGLSGAGEGSLTDLGLDVAFAVAVAFTISLELSVLLTRSVLQPLGDLRRATDTVAAGDLSARVPVVTADETGRLGGAFNEMVAGLQDREKLREAFGSYVDPDLAERVLSEGAVLEGEEVEVSVLFLDIRGFTAFAERASAREVVAQLNEFFDLVVPILVRHGGHANKFVGDGLLGVFGAPDRRPDHADRAVAAALEIGRRVREAYGERLRIGIGVNSGPVVAGTVGGGGRLEFTVIGDAVNTAARVEEVTRQTNDDVLVTEATRCLLTRIDCDFEPRGTVELKGKRERVQVHVPTAAAAPAPQPAPPRAAVPIPMED